MNTNQSKTTSKTQWPCFISIIFIASFCYYYLQPTGLNEFAWRTTVVFVATIVSIICRVLPIGALGIIAITVYALTFSGGAHTAQESINQALGAMNNSLIWLIVTAFMIARGFIKTGLGQRIALLLVKILGKRTLGLAYGLAFADLLLAPAMPSNTARCGGVIYPVADSLSRSFDSEPDNESRKKMGTFLVSCIGAVNDVTSTLFLTGFTANLLAMKLAAVQGISINWVNWFTAMLLPCTVSFILTPLIVYFLVPPEIKKTPEAPLIATVRLKNMGKMTLPEWIMIGTVLLLLVLWIMGTHFNVDQTTTAFIGLSVLLLTGVLSWDDVKNEKDAWDTLIWFSALLMLANQLGELGVTQWFGLIVSSDISQIVSGASWVFILVILNIIYCYMHYFFASGNAIVAALYTVFLGAGITLGVPALPMALMLSCMTNLSCSLTQYSHARGPILYGAGYIPTGIWWKTGFIMSLINLVIFFSVGLFWWRVLGVY
ncbi:TPA: DASS family sodium-coupled anion symporter [Escherichia coli]|nr:DASS family sodium-coupled anion symporter [Escherichia coli]HBA6952270.1 DASS family sodium-coupled anion symporter [Escherichia coli]HBA7007173.1 DASS family sodium-coupled anion symporter [Escherichia coli]HBA7957666.1 DASS family sodium-coupled anion symporter [Escherichia coli]HBA8247448.1 DASS family sodium-coupled anion symporter [Escherichia coli]